MQKSLLFRKVLSLRWLILIKRHCVNFATHRRQVDFQYIASIAGFGYKNS